MQATDATAAITRLQDLVNAGPGASPEALQEATAILFGIGGSGYLSEKVAATKVSFETWLGARKWEADGSDPQAFRMHLLQDIEKLRKALARGSTGQD
jgi:hypothetical protein